ncbi:MAG: Tex-like N-terminal domain-containing protein, partial [Rectinema sp.]
MTNRINQRIADELGVREAQVSAAVQLLDDGSTVPFVSRYRKEATGGLDDTQLRNLEERLRYLRELEGRRAAILGSIAEQGKLTPELEAAVLGAETKVALEDMYLPYKPKRRTKAQIAREAGLEPLALALLANPLLDPEREAEAYVSADKGVPDGKSALDGARQILMEQFAEDGELLGRLRDKLWQDGYLKSELAEGKAEEGAKFADYFDRREPIRAIPSHRALAMLRGRNEGALNLFLQAGKEEQEPAAMHPCEIDVARRFGIADQGRTADRWLLATVRFAWKVKLAPHLETELVTRLREAAEAEAINVFARNLHDLLL